VDPPGATGAVLQTAERAALLQAIGQQGGNMTQIARTLGVSRNTLYRKLHKYDIALPGDR
jgi:transcriptional regulator of acetoin/glycerol metabolism